MDTAYHHLEALRKEKTYRTGRRWRDELDDYWKGTNHGTLWLHNDNDNDDDDDDDDDDIYIYIYIYISVAHLAIVRMH